MTDTIVKRKKMAEVSLLFIYSSRKIFKMKVGKKIILTFILLCFLHLLNAQGSRADSLKQQLASAK